MCPTIFNMDQHTRFWYLFLLYIIIFYLYFIYYIAIASVRLSVTLSPPKPLDEIQPNLVCELLTWIGCVTTLFFFAPTPGEGPKSQIYLNIIKFQLQSQFQRFLNQTLCVLSQMKDIKHFRRDFHSVAWVMPQGSDFGVPWGGWAVQNFFFRNSTRFGVWVTYINGTWNSTISLVPTTLGPGEGPKGLGTWGCWGSKI